MGQTNRQFAIKIGRKIAENAIENGTIDKHDESHFARNLVTCFIKWNIEGRRKGLKAHGLRKQHFTQEDEQAAVNAGLEVVSKIKFCGIVDAIKKLKKSS